MHRLPEESQELLRIASAGGERVGHALLAAVSGLGPDGLIRVLRPAVTANTLLTDADGYVFRHALIREAVHEDLLPGEHGRLHARFAQAIDADHSLVPPDRAHIEMAHHWYSAHDVTFALASAWQAAAEAAKSVAHAERLNLVARVLELWDQVPDAAERIGADHTQVLEEAVEAAYDAGDGERGTSLATAALKELDAAAEPVRVAKLLHRRADFSHQLGRDNTSDLKRALELVPREASAATRARILLACNHHGGRHQPEDQAAGEEALELAREAGDGVGEASALLSLAVILADPGGMARPGGTCLEMVAAGQGDRPPGQRLQVPAARRDQRVAPAGGRGRARGRGRGGTAGCHHRGGVRAVPHVGHVPGHQPGGTAAVARPVGRGRRGHRAGEGALAAAR